MSASNIKKRPDPWVSTLTVRMQNLRKLSYLFSVIVSIIVLAGCSAALVMETNDPWEKYSQAMSLFKDRRPIPAERLLRESMEGLTKTEQYGRLAVVQLEYAAFIASPTFKYTPAFSQRFTDYGGEAGIVKTIETFNAQAEANLVKSLGTPSDVKSPAEKTQLLLLLIEAQARQGKNREACETVSLAIESYSQAKGINYEYHMWSPHGTVTEHLERRKVLLGCNAS